MAYVKLSQGFSGSVDGNSNPDRGDVIEVSDKVAADLVRQGYAEKTKKPKKEKADAGPPEAAMQKQAEPRDEGEYVCDECGDSFDSPQALGGHGRKHK